MMKTFEVRQNCEYCLLVTANSADEAMEKANDLGPDKWGQAWSTMTAEETEG